MDTERVQTCGSHLQEEADDFRDVGDDDGHLALHELVKHLHGLAGLFLYRQRLHSSVVITM